MGRAELDDIDLTNYLVGPGQPAALATRDPDDCGPFEPGGDSKKRAKKLLRHQRKRLAALQNLFYADGRFGLLLVLQTVDTGGKDGTIRRVFSGVNPQGVIVTGFKVPTAEELAHDFLWRVHAHTPARGMIAVFNRSHYEDVLVVRVKELVPEAVWRQRFELIRDFERNLIAAGTTIVKAFLHISRSEQKERLQARLDDPSKHWKFNQGDLADRALWDQTMRAYEEAIDRCSTTDAPWLVVPGNRKWYRNLVVARALIQALEGLPLRYPPIDFDPDTVHID